uniref:Uncharacterized protein n=1 Tax=Anguilla anguilla TaxID=7936 RepID=A0A0E9TVE1_ANGAN
MQQGLVRTCPTTTVKNLDLLTPLARSASKTYATD